MPRHQRLSDAERATLAAIVQRTSTRQVLAALADIVREMSDDAPCGDAYRAKMLRLILAARIDDAATSQGVL